ncbi:hypothetical protein GCM10010425_49510 [Streptomyces spororaveus]|uniref:Uncharacterized protein n=1 Tax=Streptomyces spororaveus TaxID=284039 RepID=A0ABQ3T2D2_9ACTN|nr:hypothetical protein Sspor_01060 [Streptomyces spororaveus]
MTDRVRAIEGLALVAALTAVFDSVHPLGDQFVHAATAVSTFLGVSLLRGSRRVMPVRRSARVSRLVSVAIAPRSALLGVTA